MSLERMVWWKVAALAAVFFLALYLRCESVLQTKVDRPLRADAGQYFMYAWNLKHKGVYSLQRPDPDNPAAEVKPDAVRTPGYPLFLVPFVKKHPDSKMIYHIALAQAFIGALTAVLTFFLARMFLPNGLALAVAALTAITPHLVVGCSYLLTEVLFCLLLVASALACGKLLRDASWPWALAGGAALGAAALVRPAVQYYPVLVPGFLVLGLGWSRGWKLGVVLLLGFAVSFGPWIARNLAVLGKTGEPNLVINFLHHGMYPGFKFKGSQDSFGYPYKSDPDSERISESISSVVRAVLARAGEDPLRYAKWYLLEKPVFFWSWEVVQGFGGPFVYPVTSSPYFGNDFFVWSFRLMRRAHWILVALGALGAVLAWLPASKTGLSEGRLRVARCVSMLLLYYTAVHMVGAPFPRYSIPLSPFLYALAMLPAAWLFRGRGPDGVRRGKWWNRVKDSYKARGLPMCIRDGAPSPSPGFRSIVT